MEQKLHYLHKDVFLSADYEMVDLIETRFMGGEALMNWESPQLLKLMNF